MSTIVFERAALLRREPVPAALGLLLLAAAVPTLIGLALDGRTIGGVSVWMKPLKFQVSLGVHLLTVALVVLAILTNLTALQRILYTRRAVAAREDALH